MTETYPNDDDYANLIRIAQDRLALKIDILPPDPLPAPGPKPFFSILDDALARRSPPRSAGRSGSTRSATPTSSRSASSSKNKVLRVFARRSQAYASNTHIFLFWMVGTSLVLLMIAIPFLRNQIRPITAARRGRREFRQGPAAAARLPPARRRGGAPRRPRLHPDARAHRAADRPAHGHADRRQPRSQDHPDALSRCSWRCSAASREADALNQDIDDMQSMLEGYLAFARGEAAEDTGSFDLRPSSTSSARKPSCAGARSRRRSPAARRCRSGRTPSRGCSPTSSATPSAMPRPSASGPRTRAAG